MKQFLFSIIFLFSINLYSQNKINENNYYDYYVNFENKEQKKILGNKITTNWLSKDDVIPIVIEEMKKAGHQHIFDNVLFKINDNEYIVLSVYSRKSNFGFLYIDGHDAKPQKKHRDDLTQRQEYGAEYLSYEENITGKPKINYINNLPKNLYILNENCYWYQYTENPKDKIKLVSKKDALYILRQDIKAYLLQRTK